MAIAIIALAVSFQLSYGLVRERLVHLYGEERANRHFSEALFSQALLRLRLFAGLLTLAAVALIRLRRPIAKFADPFAGALALSLAHCRRAHFQYRAAGVLPIGLIVLTGFGIRLRFLNQPMRNDESSTLLGYASQPLYLAISLYNTPNNHLFHTLLVHWSTALWGVSEWAIRLPAFLAGVLLIPLTYVFARSLASDTAALLAAALVSSSSILIEYSTNARGYTLICCATLALMVCGVRTLRNAAPAWFGVFAVATVIGFWTIPIFLIPFVATVLWMVWESFPRSRRFRRIFLMRLLAACVFAGAGTLLVYSPPLAVSGLRSLTNNEWVAPHEFQLSVRGNLEQFGSAWRLWNRDLPIWWGWIMAPAFGLGMLFYPRLRHLVVCLACWTLTLLCVRRFVPFTRTWLFFLPVFLTVAAAALARLPQIPIPAAGRRVASGILAVALAVLLSVRVLQTQSVLASAETGVLKDASRIVTFLVSRNILPEVVFRNRDYDLPLQYYWWRRFGFRPAEPALTDLRKSGGGEAWMLVNAALSESFEESAKQYGFRGARIVGEQAFDGSTLIHFTWPAGGAAP